MVGEGMPQAFQQLAIIRNEVKSLLVRANTLEGSVNRRNNNMNGFTMAMQGHEANITGLQNVVQQLMSRESSNGNSYPGSSKKLIMEYQFWDELGKLENDRTMFRSWKRKLKGTYK